MLSTTALAERLSVSVHTIRSWRMRGNGPKYTRYGSTKGPVFYREADVEEWIEQSLVEGTHQEEGLVN